MDKVEKAIETTATIDAKRQLVLDEPLPIVGPKKFVLLYYCKKK